MVPGSTFRYGSNFIRLSFPPRLSSKQPIDAADRPLPRLDTTPPVTKMYFEDISASPSLNVFDWRTWRAQSSIAGYGREGKAGVSRSPQDRLAMPMLLIQRAFLSTNRRILRHSRHRVKRPCVAWLMER